MSQYQMEGENKTAGPAAQTQQTPAAGANPPTTTDKTAPPAAATADKNVVKAVDGAVMTTGTGKNQGLTAKETAAHQKNAQKIAKPGTAFLFKYREQTYSPWQLHATFITEAKAKELFRGKAVFTRLTPDDLVKGI